jgi:hypothetical protein
MNRAFTDFTEFKSGLDVMSQALSLMGQEGDSKALSVISSDMGTATQTEQKGNVEDNGTSLTVTMTITQNISSNTKAGGPGVGDVIVFYKNMRVAWLYQEGQMQLCPFGYEYVAVTAVFLQNSLAEVGISGDDQQNLLSLDPFVSGGPGASLSPDRFSVPDGGEVNLEYGGGLNIDQKYVVTRDTRAATTNKSYTTDSSTWDPGPILKLFGIGGEKTQVTRTETNATADDVSSTVTLEANLFAGPDDYFVVTIWYDRLFGTWAFQQGQVAAEAIVSGSGSPPGQIVKLRTGNRTYVTIADRKGNYVFKARSIPEGAVSLTVGNEQATTINVTARPDIPSIHGLQGTLPVEDDNA